MTDYEKMRIFNDWEKKRNLKRERMKKYNEEILEREKRQREEYKRRRDALKNEQEMG